MSARNPRPCIPDDVLSTDSYFSRATGYRWTVVPLSAPADTGTVSASGTPESVRTSTCVAALRSELGDAGTGRRMTALLNQKVLFPHRGQATLDGTALTLGSWNNGTDLSITKDAVSRITQQFDDYYGAFVGGASSARGAPVT